MKKSFELDLKWGPFSSSADSIGASEPRRLILCSLTIVLCFSSLSTTTRAQGQPGLMVNIDSGTSTSYVDSSNMTWVPDTPYCTTGTNILNLTSSRELANLRYFPDPRQKTCYVFPSESGHRYLIRGQFFHGGYDGNLQPSLSFNVSIDATVTVSFTITNVTAVYAFTDIVQALKTQIFVCLIRNSPVANGHPFISSLQFVPLEKGMYPEAEDATGLRILSAVTRKNYGAGGTGSYAYPQDPYDRTWRSDGLGDTNSAMKTEKQISFGDAINQPPSLMMQTAKVGSFTNERFNKSNSVSSHFVLYLYFAEIDNTSTIGARVFDILVNDVLWLQGFDILAKSGGVMDQSVQLTRLIESEVPSLSLSLVGNSALPPMINAAEALQLSDAMALRALDQDVLGVESIKAAFGLNNWTGDPCMPVPYDWITCDSSSPARVITVQLANLNLAGSIPSGIGILTALLLLNLENNNLTGVVPESVLSIPGLTIQVIGNPFLQCPEKRCTFTTNGKKAVAGTKSGSSNIAIFVGAGVGGVAILIFLVILCVRRRKRNPRGHDSDTSQKLAQSLDTELQAPQENYPPTIFKASKQDHTTGSVPVLTPLEIVTGSLFVASDNNSKASEASNSSSRSRHSSSSGGKRSTTSSEGRAAINIKQDVKNYTWEEVVVMTNDNQVELGKGGFGPVYYGKLENGTEVAVKILSAASHQGTREFLNEVDLLSRVNHGNLVKLLGFCQEPKQVLIYEYAEEGTLQEHLYGGKRAETGKFDWKIRLKIAVNSACGLEYLHTGCRPSIIHRDIKSCNILLTKNMLAKVADFGLSKLGADQGDLAKSHVSTMVKGTVGYIDPDYYTSNQLTYKSDVFSFGVVLLEIITGRKPIQNCEDPDQRYIGNWVRERFKKDDIVGITDPGLDGEYNVKAMRLVIALALNCIAQRGADRPDMSEVVQQLRTAVKLERWKPSLSNTPDLMSEAEDPFSLSYNSSSPPSGSAKQPDFL